MSAVSHKIRYVMINNNIFIPGLSSIIVPLWNKMQ